MNRHTGTQKISIDFSDQCQLIFREKKGKYSIQNTILSRKKENVKRNNCCFFWFVGINSDFYYLAPELQANDDYDNDEIDGSTQIDLQVLSTCIDLPDSFASVDIVLTPDLFIQTPNVERAKKTLKQLIIPRKSVRFALNKSSSSSSSSPSSSSKAKSQRQHIQFEPYMEKVRRSNRIAERKSP